MCRCLARGTVSNLMRIALAFSQLERKVVAQAAPPCFRLMFWMV